MVHRRLTAQATLDAVARECQRIRHDAGVREDYDPAVQADAASGQGEADASHVVGSRADMTDLNFVTIDPPGAQDLDQALLIDPVGHGWRVRYAIADVGAHIVPGSALDAETKARAETVYCPDRRVGLHPPVLSEGYASLLPGQRTKAVVWDMRVDGSGEVTRASVTRAWVTSRAKYTYAQLHTDPPPEARGLVTTLARFGGARRALLRSRGAVTLPKPSQEVRVDGDSLSLHFEAGLPIEDDNAQVSLMTGMVAASMMLEAGVGVLRTMPAAPPQALTRLRHQARALGVAWDQDETYPDVLDRLDSSTPAAAAFLNRAVSLFRGAEWSPFDTADGGAVPDPLQHGALASAYAHVTAPLRRMVDRFGAEVCLAHSGEYPVPGWVAEALPALGEQMAGGVRLARRVDRECVDAVESLVLAPHVGETFAGVGLDHDTVQLAHPAVIARCDGDVTPGAEQRVRLTRAGAGTTARFEVVP